MLVGVNIGVTYLCHQHFNSFQIHPSIKKAMHLSLMLFGGYIIKNQIPSLHHRTIFASALGGWGFYMVTTPQAFQNFPKGKKQLFEFFSWDPQHPFNFGTPRGTFIQAMCVGDIFILTGNLQSGFNKTWLYSVMLSDSFPTRPYSEQGDYIGKRDLSRVFNAILPTSNEDYFKNGMNKIFKDNQQDCKWIIPIIPLKSSYGIGHCACVVIEIQNKVASITLIDSISSWSWNEHLKFITCALEASGLGITRTGDGAQYIRNQWDQDNQLQCGIHLIMNMKEILQHFQSKSLYQWIHQNNTNRSEPLDHFKMKTQADLEGERSELKKQALLHLKKWKNPHLLYYKTDNPNFGGDQEGTLKSLIDYCDTNL